MTDKEFFVQTLKDELPRFDRVFKALPAKKMEWRPHGKSRKAMELVTAMASEASMFDTILKTGKLDFMKLVPLKAKTVNAMAKHFKETLEGVVLMAKKMPQAKWDSAALMMMGDKVEWKSTRGNMLLGFLLDLIHHRGQLSVYIRPMGGKVPSIYGPSGDTNG